ncbi:MAG: SDR family NAD(P)-dependent oxidoreductase [Chitinophagaceae bacterium]|nr:MAG: SDR family NAD(P)-dependent oxidoreductase [Chitinophagaceae bacterium]
MRVKKVWLVYGANDGIGEATVKFLMLKGQQVVAITPPGELTELSHNPVPDQRLLDVYDEPQTESTVKQILHQYGSIDWLINNGNSGLLNSHVLSVMQEAGNGHIIQLTERKKYSGILSQGLPTEEEPTEREDHGVRITIIGPDTFYHSLLSLTQDNQS